MYQPPRTPPNYVPTETVYNLPPPMQEELPQEQASHLTYFQSFVGGNSIQDTKNPMQRELEILRAEEEAERLEQARL